MAKKKTSTPTAETTEETSSATATVENTEAEATNGQDFDFAGSNNDTPDATPDATPEAAAEDFSFGDGSSENFLEDAGGSGQALDMGGGGTDDAEGSSAEGENWWVIGGEGMDEEPTLNDGIPLFWISKGETQRVLILDNTTDDRKKILAAKPGDFGPFEINQHEFRQGKQRYRYTCIARSGNPCAFCQAGDKPTYFAMMTVVLLAEFKRKDGSIVKNPRRIVPFKMRNARIMRSKIARKGDLRGTIFEVSRSDDEKAAAVGDAWESDGKITSAEAAVLVDAKGNKVDLTPANYLEEFQPLSYDKATVLARKLTSSQGTTSGYLDNSPATDSKQASI